MKNVARDLASHPFFASMDRHIIDRVAACGRHESFAGGTARFCAGDPATTFDAIMQRRLAAASRQLAYEGVDRYAACS